MTSSPQNHDDDIDMSRVRDVAPGCRMDDHGCDANRAIVARHRATCAVAVGMILIRERYFYLYHEEEEDVCGSRYLDRQSTHLNACMSRSNSINDA